MENRTNNHNEEGGIYKGLFFGILFGVGLVYFLNSKTGKEIIQNAKDKIDEVLSGELVEGENEEIADDDVTEAPTEQSMPENPEEQKEKKESEEFPPRFFNKKEE